jgi:colanic acid biosynthesis glycosyl transferase WcaI
LKPRNCPRAIPHIAYVLVGDGSMRKPLEQRARERALGNVHFIALQPAEVFHNLLAASDLAVVTQQRSVADIVFPSKVLTLLASARPVVASLNESSEVARVLREAGAGVVVEPETPSALFESVTALRADAGRRAAMSARGRLYARQQWDRDQILARMEGQLQALWQRSSRGGGVTREADPILSTAK